MTQKLKIRSYAIFQFISFIAIVSSLISLSLIAFVISKEVGVKGTLLDKELWAQYIEEVMRFHSGSIGISASLFIYFSIVAFVLSWVSGLMILKVPDRNLFDSLFLLFVMLPIISNIFALFGQVSTKEIEFASSKINKKQIIEEQTRIINIKEKNDNKVLNKNLNDTKENKVK